MSNSRFSWTRLLFLLLVVVPVASWFVVKPVRVIAPTWAGVSCPTANVCVDDPARLEEARALYEEAEAFVSANVYQMGRLPRVVFCSSEACAQGFGLGPRAAVTVGTFGTVIGPRAWTPYLVRHEMIHFLQGRRLHALALLVKPRWFVEGMAYALSDDPRRPLDPPFEAWRQEFLDWYGKVGKDRLWSEAGRL